MILDFLPFLLDAGVWMGWLAKTLKMMQWYPLPLVWLNMQFQGMCCNLSINVNSAWANGKDSSSVEKVTLRKQRREPTSEPAIAIRVRNRKLKMACTKESISSWFDTLGIPKEPLRYLLKGDSSLTLSILPSVTGIHAGSSRDPAAFPTSGAEFAMATCFWLEAPELFTCGGGESFAATNSRSRNPPLSKLAAQQRNARGWHTKFKTAGCEELLMLRVCSAE